MKRMGLKTFKKEEEGSIGIGAMIIFIAMILVAAVAATVLTQTANQLQTQAMRTGQETIGEVASGISITDICGYVEDDVIDRVTISIRTRAGSSNMDLNEVVVEFTDGVKKCILTLNLSCYSEKVGEGGVFNESATFNLSATEFGIIKLEDADGSCTNTTPVINRGDYIMLTVNTTACFGGLNARTDIWGQVIPEEGSQGLFAFRCPPSLTATIYDLY